jgi:hypothetical protein
MTTETEQQAARRSPEAEETAAPAPKNGTRRRGFGAGLRLAAAGSAALAALPLGVAAASNDGDDRRRRGLERAIEAREEALRRFRERLDDRRGELAGVTGVGGAMRLVAVADVPGSDYPGGGDGANRDSLTRGAIRLLRESNNDARINVSLDGAAANATYELIFYKFNDKGRDRVGWVRTNGNGDFDGLARSNQDNTGDAVRFGGGNRVGVFVLNRDGRDRFVTALPTRSS